MLRSPPQNIHDPPPPMAPPKQPLPKPLLTQRVPTRLPPAATPPANCPNPARPWCCARRHPHRHPTGLHVVLNKASSTCYLLFLALPNGANMLRTPPRAAPPNPLTRHNNHCPAGAKPICHHTPLRTCHCAAPTQSSTCVPQLHTPTTPHAYTSAGPQLHNSKRPTPQLPNSSAPPTPQLQTPQLQLNCTIGPPVTHMLTTYLAFPKIYTMLRTPPHNIHEFPPPTVPSQQPLPASANSTS